MLITWRGVGWPFSLPRVGRYKRKPVAIERVGEQKALELSKGVAVSNVGKPAAAAAGSSYGCGCGCGGNEKNRTEPFRLECWWAGDALFI